MNPAAAAILAALSGAQLALQAPVNRGLSRLTGPIGAAFVSYMVGTLALGIACLLAGEMTGIARLGSNWWHACDGFLGSFYVLSALVVVRSIGASGIAAGTVTGQLSVSVLIDAAGWFEVDPRPLDPTIVLGAIGVLAGTYLIAGLPWGRTPGVAGVRSLLPLLTIIGGGAMIGLQNPINAEIAKTTGQVSSAFLTFVSGGLLIGIALLATRSVRALAAVPQVRPPYLTGGLYGATNALVALILIREFGAGIVVAAGVTGQMLRIPGDRSCRPVRASAKAVECDSRARCRAPDSRDDPGGSVSGRQAADKLAGGRRGEPAEPIGVGGAESLDALLHPPRILVIPERREEPRAVRGEHQVR